MSAYVIKGPCLVQFGSNKFYTEDGVEVSLNNKTLPIPTDAFGQIDERFMDANFTITMKPLGQFTVLASIVDAVLQMTPGTPLFGAVGSPTALIIKPLLTPQKQLSFPRAALTKLPSLTLSATKTLWGSMTFTAIRNGAVATAGSLVVEADFAAITDRPNPTEILTLPWSAIWDIDVGDPAVGAWNGFDTESGWTLDLGLKASEDTNDSLGVVGMTVEDISVTAKCVPLVGQADIVAAIARQGSGYFRGASMRPGPAQDWGLHIISEEGNILLPSAALIDASESFNVKKQRVQACTWRAQRKFVEGVMQPLITFDV